MHFRGFEALTLVIDYRACYQLGPARNALHPSLLVAFCPSKLCIAHHCFWSDTYYLAFPKDRLLAKLQVYGVLFCEFLQTAIVAHDVVVALVSSLGDPKVAALDSLHTNWFSIPVAGGISEYNLLLFHEKASLLINWLMV